MRRFTRFACIDWSGQAVARPRGLALALCATGSAAPDLVPPVGGWSRAALADWLRAQAEAESDLIVGIDFSPAFPFADRDAYFPEWSDSPADARALWALVERLCAHEPHGAASGFSALEGARRHFRRQSGRSTETGDLFGVGAGRLRVTERRLLDRKGGHPASCFNLVGAKQVGKSSLTGMRLLHALAGRVPIWPFDPVPATGPLLVEIYTGIAAIAAGRPPGRTKIRDAAALDAALATLGSAPHAALDRYDDHSTDAIVTAAWLRRAAAEPALWSPQGLAMVAQTEGWTFGVP